MATLKLRYVHGFTDRHGHARHYFRKAGKNTPLPGLIGSPEFMDAYGAALASLPPPVPKRAAIISGSFKELALAYYGSPQFRDLASSSRANYRRVIENFLVSHGHRRVDQMRREHVMKIVGEMADKPGAGIVLLKRIRTLTTFALELGWIAVDPTHKVRSYRSKEFHTWDEEEIAAFEARWPAGTKQRLAFAMHLYTGQRGSDVHRMTWRDIAGDTIRVAQTKTGAKLVVTLHPALQSILAQAPRGHVAILTTDYGKPFTVKGFGNFVADAIRAAALPARCVPHGLRKAAARRLAEVGCSANQIASVTGHKTLAEVERYTRAADQVRLNRQAIEKQAGNTEWQTGPKPLATLAEKS
jgi:integrase